jgi:hypothetical protein
MTVLFNARSNPPQRAACRSRETMQAGTMFLLCIFAAIILFAMLMVD